MLELISMVIVAILPALVLIYYIFRRDKYQREPVKQLVKAFGFGVVSAFIVLFVFGPIINLVSIEKPSTVIEAFVEAFVSAAIPEELAMFFCLWLFLRKNKFFDEYIDGIVYAVCIKMGFAAIENVDCLLSEADAWVEVGIMRGILAVPGHFFDGVAMGYFYSKAAFGDPGRRTMNYLLALAIPILFHGLWDGLAFIPDSASEYILVTASILFCGLLFYLFFVSKKRIRKHVETRILVEEDNPEPPVIVEKQENDASEA